MSGGGDARAALTAGFTDARPVQAPVNLKSQISNLRPPAKAATRPTPNQIRAFREKVGQLEKAVVELEKRQAEITAALEAPETYADKGRFHHLNRELSTVVDQITTATAEWEAAATKLEDMEKD
jgi:ATP-binding cassette subfamily F protein 3